MDTTDRLDRPNVIWIFGDQHRAQALGYRGDRNVSTPNIDRLARDGVRFDCAVAGAPWCTPFRASLLTSTYPHQNGCVRTPSPLDPSIPTITAPLKEAGYHTAYVGKWHLDGSNGEHYIPPERRGGFDHWVGYENNNAQYRVYVHGAGCEDRRRLDGYETDALTDLFIDHLTRHCEQTGGPDEREQPFFGVLSVQPPHGPYVAPEEFARNHRPAEIAFRPNVPDVPRVADGARLDLAGYYAQIENLDWNLGRIRAALRRLNIDEHTHVVFFSDHGNMLGSHGQKEKSSPWEESIRIPMVFGGLRQTPLARGGVCDAVMNHVDIAPTTLGLCGIRPPQWMVGYDYSRNALPKDHPHYRAEPDRSAEPQSAYCQQIPRKFHPHSVNKQWRAVVTRDGWKYVIQPGHDWLMHDLNEDPCEQVNLAHDRVFDARRQELRALLGDWIRRTGDEFDLPPE